MDQLKKHFGEKSVNELLKGLVNNAVPGYNHDHVADPLIENANTESVLSSFRFCIIQQFHM